MVVVIILFVLRRRVWKCPHVRNSKTKFSLAYITPIFILILQNYNPLKSSQHHVVAYKESPDALCCASPTGDPTDSLT